MVEDRDSTDVAVATAVATATAATGLIVVALRWELKEERDRRQAQDKEVTALGEKLVRFRSMARFLG